MPMRNHQSLAVSLFFIVGLQTMVWAADPHVAQIVYREGRPVVFRDGLIVWDPIEFGFRLEIFDLIRNDSESLVQIRTESQTGIDVAIIAAPRTTFSLGLPGDPHDSRDVLDSMTGLDVMTGAVAISVTASPGTADRESDAYFTVRTEHIVIETRSASFDVTLSPRGDVLISAREGLVEARLTDGRVLFARPGVVIESTTDGVFRNVAVPAASLAEFRSRWSAGRAASVRADLETVLTPYAELYGRLRERFDEQYAALFSRRDILDTWMRESEHGRVGSAADVAREKSEIGPYLVDIRPTVGQLEKVFYRVLELREFVADGHANGRNGTQSAVAFFGVIDAERRVLEQRMMTVRHVLKMYANRAHDPRTR